MVKNNSMQNIPKGWQRLRLGQITDITNGKTNSQDAISNGRYPLFDRSTEIKRSNKYLFDATAIILPGEGADFVPKYFSGKFDLHQRAYAIFPHQNIDSKFLFQNIYANRQILVKRSVGSTVKSLRLPIIQGMDILLPIFKEEQKKIAEILESVDEEIQTIDEITAATQKLKKGLMQKLFTQGIAHTKVKKTKIGEIPEEWNLRPIEKLCENLDNRRVPVSKEKRESGDIPYYGATGIVDYVSHHIFDEDLLLIGEDGADWSRYANTAYLISGKSWVNNHAHVLRCTKINKIYLKEYLNFQDLNIFITGGTRGKLTKGVLSQILVPVPKDKEEEDKIAYILSNIDDKILVNQRLREKLTLLKKGLTQDLLSGKIRVAHWWYSRCQEIDEFREYYWNIFDNNQKFLEKDFVDKARRDPFSMFYELYILKNLQEAGFSLNQRNSTGPDFTANDAVLECTVPAVAKDYKDTEPEAITIDDPITGKKVTHELATKIDDDIKKLRFSSPIKSKIDQYKKHKDSNSKPFILCICGSKLEAGEKEDGSVIKDTEQFSIFYKDFGTTLDPVAQLLFGFEEKVEILAKGAKLVYPEKRDIKKGDKVLDDIHGIFRRSEYSDVSAILFTPYDGVRMNQQKLSSFLYINPNAIKKLDNETIKKISKFCNIIV